MMIFISGSVGDSTGGSNSNAVLQIGSNGLSVKVVFQSCQTRIPEANKIRSWYFGMFH